MPVLVIDNGAYNIKCGYAELGLGGLVKEYNSITRATNDRKTFIGNQIYNAKDFSGLQFRRPIEKGQLVNWEGQKAIWDHMFYGTETALTRPSSKNKRMVVNPSDTSLVLTEMPLSLPALSSNMDQIVFEEYGFESYYRCTPASLVPWNNISEELFNTKKNSTSPVAECTLVIDSGFSATHIIPVICGEVYWPAVQRITVGGKMLTNYLRETCSFRYYNMMNDTYIMNLVKEATCYVSPNFERDIELCHQNKKNLLKKYVLPNFQNHYGHVAGPDEQVDPKDAVLTLQNERFTVPELLFNPGIIDMDQAGISEAAIRCVNSVPDEDTRSLLLANVVLTGGNTKLEGYKERIGRELRSLTPQEWTLRVGTPHGKYDPETYAFKGGCELGTNHEMLQKAYVTRKEYLEHGPNICMSKFGMKVQDSALVVE